MNISRKNFLVGAAATAITAPTVHGDSLGGAMGRARGLMGGCFMGTMMAQQGGGSLPYKRALLWVMVNPESSYVDTNMFLTTTMVMSYDVGIRYADSYTRLIGASVGSSGFFGYSITRLYSLSSYRIVADNRTVHTNVADVAWSSQATYLLYKMTPTSYEIDGYDPLVQARNSIVGLSSIRVVGGLVRRVTLEDGGATVFDGIPVMDNSDHPALYDQIGGGLYYGVGGGDLTYAEIP